MRYKDTNLHTHTVAASTARMDVHARCNASLLKVVYNKCDALHQQLKRSECPCRISIVAALLMVILFIMVRLCLSVVGNSSFNALSC